MMRRYISQLILILSFAILGACDVENPDNILVGGGCEYETYSGNAEIISVTLSGQSELSCTNPVDVIYRFTPDDPNQVNNYQWLDGFPDDNLVCWPPYCSGQAEYAEAISDLSYIYTPFSQEWVDELGLSVGSTHRVERTEQVGSGSCYPVSFNWPDLKAHYDAMSDTQRNALPACDQAP